MGRGLGGWGLTRPKLRQLAPPTAYQDRAGKAELTVVQEQVGVTPAPRTRSKSPEVLGPSPFPSYLSWGWRA